MFYALGLVLGGTEGAESRFHVLHSRTHFQRYRGCRVPFSCLALPDLFWAVPRASGPIFMFCVAEPVLGGIVDVRSSFHILRSLTHFGQYRGRQVSFSCFPLLNSFSAVPRASGLVFMFCAPVLVFEGTDGAGSHFYVLRSRTCFVRFRVCRVPFSCFSLPYLFWAVPWAPGPVFMFCVPKLNLGGTVGATTFHLLRSRTRFRRY
jgi:hypothetical protein